MNCYNGLIEKLQKEITERSDMNTKMDDIEINDIQLAGYLIIKDIPYTRIERAGRYGTFFFPSNKAKPRADEYILGQALVEPKSFMAAIRRLRAAVDMIDKGNENHAK